MRTLSTPRFHYAHWGVLNRGKKNIRAKDLPSRGKHLETLGSAETIPEHTYTRSKTSPAETNPADNVCLSAAENGDHAVSQKMVDDAAVAWGGKAYYHASNDAWSILEDRPIYLTTSVQVARKYNPTGVVRKFYVKFPGRGIYKAVKGETSYMHYGMTDLARRLSDEGYAAMQGLPAAPGYGGAEVVVLKPQGIVQLADPIVRGKTGKIVPLSERFPLKPTTKPKKLNLATEGGEQDVGV